MCVLPILSLGKEASSITKLLSGLINAAGEDADKVFAELGINSDGTFSMFNDFVMCFKAMFNGGAGYNTLFGAIMCVLFVIIIVTYIVKLIKMITMKGDDFNVALYEYCLILKKKDKTKKDKASKKLEVKAAGKVGGGNNLLGFIISPLIVVIYALGMSKVLGNSVEKFEQVTPMIWVDGINFGSLIPIIVLIIVGIVFAVIQSNYQKKIIAVVEDKANIEAEEEKTESASIEE